MRELNQVEKNMVTGGGLSDEQRAILADLIESGVLTQRDVTGDLWIPSQLSGVRTIASLQGTTGSRGSGSRLS